MFNPYSTLLWELQMHLSLPLALLQTSGTSAELAGCSCGPQFSRYNSRGLSSCQPTGSCCYSLDGKGGLNHPLYDALIHEVHFFRDDLIHEIDSFQLVKDCSPHHPLEIVGFYSSSGQLCPVHRIKSLDNVGMCPCFLVEGSLGWKHSGVFGISGLPQTVWTTEVGAVSLQALKF